MDNPTPHKRDLERAAEAFRFIDGQMGPEEAEAYREHLRQDPDARTAAANALALGTIAREGLGHEPQEEVDPEYCAQIREQLELFVSNGLSSAQREDVDEHLESCGGCQERMAEVQRKRQTIAVGEKRKPVLVGASAVLLVVLGGVGGWVVRPAPPPAGVQEDALTGRNAVFSDDERVEFGATAMSSKNPRQLGAAAASIIRKVPLGRLSRDDLHRQANADLRRCVSLLGRAGGSEFVPQGSKAWIRRALVHPNPKVRQEAAVWYPVVDKSWKSNEELRHLVEAARRATPLPELVEQDPQQ